MNDEDYGKFEPHINDFGDDYLEYNPDYIQLVAMAIPYIIEQDSPPILVR